MTGGRQAALHEAAAYAQGFPHERFAELRASGAFHHFDHPAWESGYTMIVRHAEVSRVSRESQHFKNAPAPFLPDGPAADAEGSTGLLISLDAPDHQKMRLLISRGFTPKRVAGLEEGLRARTHSILDGLRDQRECDLVEDIAMWLPLHVIADLVGVPEADRRQVFEWTELTFGFDPTVTPEQRANAAFSMYAYADAMCEERQKAPRDDLMSVLLGAEVDGERLTQMQIALFFLLLQNAGSETTRNLITSGLIALLAEPEQYAALQADTANLLPTAIEELLRFTTPVIQFVRTASSDVQIEDTTFHEGDKVVLVYSSANRDDTVFDAPDRLDIFRDRNPHVAFGAGGPHFCLGANLARIEGRVMFEALLSRFKGLSAAGDPATWPRVHSNLIDGYATAPISWSGLD